MGANLFNKPLHKGCHVCSGLFVARSQRIPRIAPPLGDTSIALHRGRLFTDVHPSMARVPPNFRTLLGHSLIKLELPNQLLLALTTLSGCHGKKVGCMVFLKAAVFHHSLLERCILCYNEWYVGIIKEFCPGFVKLPPLHFVKAVGD